VQLTFNSFTTSSWSPLNFTAETTLNVGGTTQALPEGNVSAFGVYAAKTTDKYVRFDTYEVAAVPEPGALAFLAAGGLMLASRRRKSVA
jgi:hypothetical protein